jgi:Mg-chelatase subunit ChlD
MKTHDRETPSRTKCFAAALFAVTAAAVLLYPSFRSAATAPGGTAIALGNARHKVEVVFVLDTTGSMSGLIETAKEKIWSIASTMAQADQAPEIRIGLVAYRDRGDAYITRTVDLSNDLDTMYATLMEFSADGGGDGPESVNRALADAIEQISWSQDPSSYRVVFLVGDAPPHMDYQDEARYPEILAAAAARGIVVNTIQCGDLAQTAQVWTDIALLGNGRYFQVTQAGSGIAIATPFDADLARLSADLDQTRLFYGSGDVRAAMDGKVAATEKLHELASPESRARRAAFNASASGVLNLFGEHDLVADVENGRVEIDAIPPDELPEALRALDADEQQALVAGLSDKRAVLEQGIRALTAERDAYIAAEVEATGGGADSLDRQLYDVVREQAAPKGLVYSTGPQY